MPIITPIIGITPAAVFTNLWGLFPTTANIIQYRKYIDWKFVGKVLIGAIPAAIGGIFLIPFIEPRILEIILGSFIVVFACIKLYIYLFRDRKSKPEGTPEPIERKIPDILIYFGGFSNGFLASLISAAGPINVALLESTGHHRESLIANFSAILLPLTLIRMVLYFIKGLFPTELWIVFVLAIPIILIFTKLGHLLTPKIPVKTFQIIVLIFLVVVGIKFFF